MARPSSIDRLPEEVRTAISELRGQGCTIDMILDKLRELVPDGASPSRSALHRHIQGLDKLAERVNRSRVVASALVDKLGKGGESRAARANIELLHSAVLELFMSVEQGGEDGQPTVLDPKSVAFLAGALKDLASAAKTDADLVMKIREEVAKEMRMAAAKAADVVAREKGISADTANAIKASILGVTLPAKGAA